MNDNMTDTEPQPDDVDEDALRRRLINRVALAAVAIVALLGGLAVIDSMYVAPTSPASKVAISTIGEEAPKPDAVDASPVAEPERKPEAQPAARTPPEPPQPQAVPTIKSTAEPEESASPSVILPSQPSHATTVSPPHPQAPKPATQVGRQFVLQMGVFNDLDNAQQLLDKLRKLGVPAQIEARVQVGPFKTKAEADSARAKLKASGINSGLLMAIRR